MGGLGVGLRVAACLVLGGLRVAYVFKQWIEASSYSSLYPSALKVRAENESPNCTPLWFSRF